MLRLPLIATAVVVAAVVLIPTATGREHVLVSLVAAIVLVLGVWFAPSSFERGETGSILSIGREIWSQRMARLKALQLVIGGLAVVGLVMMNAFDLGVSVIFGIALALGMAASPSRARDQAGTQDQAPEGDDAPARW